MFFLRHLPQIRIFAFVTIDFVRETSIKMTILFLNNYFDLFMTQVEMEKEVATAESTIARYVGASRKRKVILKENP